MSNRIAADRYGFTVLEDASYAIGGRHLGEPVVNVPLLRYSGQR